MLARILLGTTIPIVAPMTFVSSSIISITGNSSTTLSINTPSGTQSGDLIIAVSTSSNRANGHTCPDFTQICYSGAASGLSGRPKTTVLYKLLSGSPAASYNFTISGGYGSTAYLALFTFRPNKTPSVGAFSARTDYPTGTSMTAGAITTTSSGYIFRVFSTSDTAATATMTVDTTGYTVLDQPPDYFGTMILVSTNLQESASVPALTGTTTWATGWQGITFSIYL